MLDQQVIAFSDVGSAETISTPTPHCRHTYIIVVRKLPMPVVLCMLSRKSYLPIQGKTALHNPECL